MSKKYVNAAQQRVLKTLRILIDHAAADMAPGEIASEVDTLPSNTTRDLANLRIAGLVETDEGRWRLSSRFLAKLVASRRKQQQTR